MSWGLVGRGQSLYKAPEDRLAPGFPRGPWVGTPPSTQAPKCAKTLLLSTSQDPGWIRRRGNCYVVGKHILVTHVEKYMGPFWLKGGVPEVALWAIQYEGTSVPYKHINV